MRVTVKFEAKTASEAESLYQFLTACGWEPSQSDDGTGFEVAIDPGGYSTLAKLEELAMDARAHYR